jgi:1,4-alpha-glucan branching enzyme
VDLPEAKDVFVAGDFNGWRADPSSAMANSNNGTWSVRMKLKPGQYRYRFVVDGKWISDPGNPTTEINPYGEHDSLLNISA